MRLKYVNLVDDLYTVDLILSEPVKISDFIEKISISDREMDDWEIEYFYADDDTLLEFAQKVRITIIAD